jgi:hypothetical protein
VARLKRTNTSKPVPLSAPEPLPEHVRVAEWGEIKAGDPVIVSIPGKKYKRSVYWTFFAHVTAPGGTEYIDVYERKAGDPHGLWRSFRPDQVTAKPQPKRKVKFDSA